jgi:hypothetical protein
LSAERPNVCSRLACPTPFDQSVPNYGLRMFNEGQGVGMQQRSVRSQATSEPVTMGRIRRPTGSAAIASSSGVSRSASDRTWYTSVHARCLESAYNAHMNAGQCARAVRSSAFACSCSEKWAVRPTGLESRRPKRKRWTPKPGLLERSAAAAQPANVSGIACYHFATQFGSTRRNQAGRGGTAAWNCADNSVLRDTGWYGTIRG